MMTINFFCPKVCSMCDQLLSLCIKKCKVCYLNFFYNWSECSKSGLTIHPFFLVFTEVDYTTNFVSRMNQPILPPEWEPWEIKSGVVRTSAGEFILKGITCCTLDWSKILMLCFIVVIVTTGHLLWNFLLGLTKLRKDENSSQSDRTSGSWFAPWDLHKSVHSRALSSACMHVYVRACTRVCVYVVLVVLACVCGILSLLTPLMYMCGLRGKKRNVNNPTEHPVVDSHPGTSTFHTELKNLLLLFEWCLQINNSWNVFPL